MMLCVILLSVAIYIALYSNCDQVSDAWQQLQLASKLESDLWDTVDWDSKWFIDFNAGKTQTLCLTTGFIWLV